MGFSEVMSLFLLERIVFNRMANSPRKSHKLLLGGGGGKEGRGGAEINKILRV